MDEAIDRGLAFIDSLDRDERSAFLALFAGARSELTSFNGGCPTFGKAECEWVKDWLDFYRDRLAAQGLVAFQLGEARPALGMGPPNTFRDVLIAPTDMGYLVREAWWDRLNQRIIAEEARRAAER